MFLQHLHYIHFCPSILSPRAALCTEVIFAPLACLSAESYLHIKAPAALYNDTFFFRLLLPVLSAVSAVLIVPLFLGIRLILMPLGIVAVPYLPDILLRGLLKLFTEIRLIHIYLIVFIMFDRGVILCP